MRGQSFIPAWQASQQPWGRWSLDLSSMEKGERGVPKGPGGRLTNSKYFALGSLGGQQDEHAVTELKQYVLPDSLQVRRQEARVWR